MAGISWESEDKTLLRLNLGQGWTWQFFDTLIDSAFALMRDTPHNVALIILDEDLGYQMPHGAVLTHFRRAADLMPPNASFICIVAADQFTRAMISLLSAFNRNVREKVVVVDTLDAARKLFPNRLSKS